MGNVPPRDVMASGAPEQVKTWASECIHKTAGCGLILSAGGGVSPGTPRPMDITAAAHAAQLQDFVDAIRQRGHPAVDGKEGRRSVEVVEAIYRSARTDAPVALPL